jgi:chromosome segregation ATPase
MAGPTDVLTEDVKDLREANRQLAAEIKGVFERLSADLRDSNQQLAAETKGVFERLSADLRDSNQRHERLSAELREQNQRLTDAITGVARDLGTFRVEVTKELGEIRAEVAKDLGEVRAEVAKDLGEFRVAVAKELGEIKTTLEKYQSETATALRFAGRSVLILIPVVIGLVGATVGIAFYAGRLDGRLQQVEKRLEAGGPTQQPPEKGPATVLIPKGSPATSERGR